MHTTDQTGAATAEFIKGAAFTGFDFDPNNCNRSFIHTANLLGNHDFDGMMANQIIDFMNAHPEKYKKVSAPEAADAAIHGHHVASGLRASKGSGHVQTIIDAPMREPDLTSHLPGEVYPVAVSGAQSN